jgi:hypothetical protein
MQPIDRWKYGKSLLGKEPGCVLIFAIASFLLGMLGLYTWSWHRASEAKAPSLIREVIREHNIKRPPGFEPKGAAQRGAERLALRATDGEEIVSFNMGRPWTRFNGYTMMRLDLNLKSGKQMRLRLGLWGRMMGDISALDEASPNP